ncbi:MAG: hypothetical protein JSW44_00150 [Candidatus Bathyarchaeota archaeon]|nr:MAG: hypothetical protein JSW44_00150 [Candidatus Bathyarchaeota archaeon]
MTYRVKLRSKQMIVGARKWKLNLIDRNDPMSLSERATKATGIPTADEVEKGAIEKILEFQPFSFSYFKKVQSNSRFMRAAKR